MIAGSAGPGGPASLAQPWPLREGLELKQSVRRHFLANKVGKGPREARTKGRSGEG